MKRKKVSAPLRLCVKFDLFTLEMPDPTLPLRPARESDLPAIKRLIKIGGINPMGIKWPRFAVIESPQGEVIAIGQNKPHGDDSTELASLVVHPDWRGQGLARRVIEHLVDAHPGALYLMCGADLGPFYEKFGFSAVEDAHIPRFFARVRGMTKLANLFVDLPLLIMVREGDNTQ
jgi:N-acetylglutamate synthase-like GNAT family acetyltransferase